LTGAEKRDARVRRNSPSLLGIRSATQEGNRAGEPRGSPVWGVPSAKLGERNPQAMVLQHPAGDRATGRE